MELYLRTMLQVRQAADQLHHDAKILDLQGRHEEATRKRKALRIAEDEYSSLNQKYRTLWMRRRKRELPPNSASLSLFPNPSCPIELLEFDINTHTHHFHSLLLSFIPQKPMTTATAIKSPALKNVFPTQKPEQQPKTIPQDKEGYARYMVQEAFKKFLAKRYGKQIRKGKRLDQILQVLNEMFPALPTSEL